MSVRSVQFGDNDQADFQILDESAGWREQVDDILEAMVHDAANMVIAIIRRNNDWVLSWGSNLQNTLPRLPLVSHTRWRDHRELWDSYTPDVFGVQILTRAYLVKTNDLSAWKSSRSRRTGPWCGHTI